jgi:hypothetical protein
MNCKHTDISPWLCVLHKHLGSLINDKVHEFVKTLWRMSVLEQAHRKMERGIGWRNRVSGAMFIMFSMPSCLHEGFNEGVDGVKGRSRTIMRPSIRMSMLSYSQMTTFCFCR